MAFEARQWLSQELLAGRALVQTAGRGSWAVGAPRMPGCGRMAVTETCRGPPAPQGHAVTPRRPHGAPGGPPASVPPGPSIFFSFSFAAKRRHEEEPRAGFAGAGCFITCTPVPRRHMGRGK